MLNALERVADAALGVATTQEIEDFKNKFVRLWRQL